MCRAAAPPLAASSLLTSGQRVRVRFFALGSELSRLTAADGNTTLARLRLAQYSGPNEDCDLTNNAPGGAHRQRPPSTTALSGAGWFTAQATVADYFAEFYLTGASTTLPVQLLAFSAGPQGLVRLPTYSRAAYCKPRSEW